MARGGLATEELRSGVLNEASHAAPAAVRAHSSCVPKGAQRRPRIEPIGAVHRGAPPVSLKII
eukprot:5643030-Alexandrium_andersonii.AAC.1